MISLLNDPRTLFPKVDPPKQSQPEPGLDIELSPKPILVSPAIKEVEGLRAARLLLLVAILGLELP